MSAEGLWITGNRLYVSTLKIQSHLETEVEMETKKTTACPELLQTGINCPEGDAGAAAAATRRKRNRRKHIEEILTNRYKCTRMQAMEVNRNKRL